MSDPLTNGWYRLPSDAPHIIRYWDGANWSGPHVLAQTNATGMPAGATPAPQTPATFQPGSAYSTGAPAGEPGYPNPGPATYGHSMGYEGVGINPPDLAKPGAIGPRLLARAIDTGIELCLYLLLLLPASDVSVGHRGFWQQFPGMSSAPPVWAIVAGIVAFFAWEWAWVSQRGATPGKQLAGLYVTLTEPPDPNNPFPPPKIAARRFAYRGLFGIPILGFIVWSLETFVSLWYMREDAEQHRSFPDRLAGTRVVGSVHPPRITTMPSGRAPVWIVGSMVTFVVLVALNWNFVKQPVFRAADDVMADLRDNNLAEATASFAQSCPIDRQRYAEHFSRIQITNFEMERADVEWAVPFFSGDEDRSRAVVTGRATVLDEGVARPYAVSLELVREDGRWRPCELLP